MSALCMYDYEFEGISWDDLCPSDDRTVPRLSSEKFSGISSLADMKPRREVVNSLNVQDRSAHGSIYDTRECREFASLSERSKILDKGMFSSSVDRTSTKEASCVVASEDMSSSHVFKSNDAGSNENGFCVNLDDKTAVADKNSFSYPLADATNADSNLDFFANAGARDSGDLLYYDWPEIGIFEDVDRMFRSCDSTFGLERSKDDVFGWLSSADDVGESKDEMETNTRFTFSENDSKSTTVNDPAMTSAPNMFNDIWSSDKSQSYLSFVDGTALADGENGFTAEDQMINNRNQSKLQKHSGEKRKGHHPGNGSFSYSSNLSNETPQVPSKATSHLGFSSGVMQQHQPLCPRSYGYIQNPLTCTYSGSTCLPGPKLTNHAPSDSTKKAQLKFENNSDAEGSSPTIPAEIGSSNVQESPAESSTAEDNSMEASSFRQLQLVMEQLDLKTKLCIRDSLYRLARSAEQRHNQQANSCHDGDEMEGNGALTAEDASNFIDMERQTNPIDRSIAHLLFHRAPEPSVVPPG